jgi:hypothetical protein
LFDSIGTIYNDGTADRQIDLLSNPGDSIAVKPTLAATTSAMFEIRTIPPNASATNVDLYMRFSFGYFVPSGTIITVTPPSAA